MTQSIVVEQPVAAPPTAVWPYLTEPDLFARWWVPGDIAPVVGHVFTLDMGPWGAQECEVLAVEPARRLHLAYARGVLDTTLTFTLVPEGAGTRLILEHAGFDLDAPLGRTAFEGMGAGWPTLAAHLAQTVAGA